MDKSTGTPDGRLRALDALVGTWVMEASFPAGAPEPIANRTFRGEARNDWILDGQFLLQHESFPDAAAPESWAVVGLDAEHGYIQHYFDSRGVTPVYAMTLEGGTMGAAVSGQAERRPRSRYR